MDSDLRTRRRRLRGFSVNRLIPNVLTLAALCSGLTAIRFALQGEMRLAVIAIIVAAIFDAHLMMLSDVKFLGRVEERIRNQRVNAEWAVQQVFHEFSAVFNEVADPYLRERKGDVGDLVGRLRMNLRRGASTPRDLLSQLDESSVLIADELTPSIAAQVDWTKVRGFATDAGSRSSAANQQT